jgi:hypothetical protein
MPRAALFSLAAIVAAVLCLAAPAPPRLYRDRHAAPVWRQLHRERHRATHRHERHDQQPLLWADGGGSRRQLHLAIDSRAALHELPAYSPGSGSRYYRSGASPLRFRPAAMCSRWCAFGPGDFRAPRPIFLRRQAQRKEIRLAAPAIRQVRPNPRPPPVSTISPHIVRIIIGGQMQVHAI